jgi:multidrug efflux pump subunit AcrA (membrane-fusion protein)
MGLQGEEGYPHEGTVNFVNNQVDPATGSILVRGVFPNPQPPGGVRLLSPGMFVWIRLPIGQPHPARLVIDRAVGSDQGLKYVYVLDAEGEVRYHFLSGKSRVEEPPTGMSVSSVVSVLYLAGTGSETDLGVPPGSSFSLTFTGGIPEIWTLCLPATGPCGLSIVNLPWRISPVTVGPVVSAAGSNWIVPSARGVPLRVTVPETGNLP